MTKTDRPIPLFDRGIIPLFLPLLQEFDLESVFLITTSTYCHTRIISTR